MSMLYLAFLHGEQVLFALLLAGAVILIALPVLFYVWIWHSKISELKLSIAFFVLISALSVLLFIVPDNPTSVLTLTVFSFVFILCLPWSFLALIVNAEMSKNVFTLLTIGFAGLNSAIMYFIAVRLRRIVN